MFVGLLVAYFGGAAIYFTVVGRWSEWVVRPAYPFLTIAALTFSAARLLVARLARHGASTLWRMDAIVAALLVLVVIVPFQTTFSSIKRTIDNVQGFSWDPWLADLDRAIHGGRHPWEWLYWIVQDKPALFWLDSLYLWWFPVMSLFLFWAAWTPWRRLRQRALVSTVLVWVVCGNLMAFALASAGPCYYREVAPDRPNPYARLLDTLDLHARSGEYVQARVLQRQLWKVTIESPLEPFRGVSAMPSVHVAMAVLLALVGWARHPLAGVALSLFAVLIMVGSVVLAWHYAVDGYVGGLMAVGCWRLSGRLAPRIEDMR
jgi:membrane-associated phospholipid phosphatase